MEIRSKFVVSPVILGTSEPSDISVAEPENVSRGEAFLHAPHRTMIRLSVPVLFSLIAEPLTGLVDTAFVARLGASPLAALGVGTIVLSSIFWIFNFLGIGTQTRIAQADGEGLTERIALVNGIALLAAGVLGVFSGLVGFAVADSASMAMGARDEVRALATQYMQIRLAGAPAVLITIAAFGTLRGLQQMRAPMIVALGINALNIVLDPLFIFGWGSFPALGIAGAAWASVISQWIGAIFSLTIVLRMPGIPREWDFTILWDLFRIGGDLFIRTAMLSLFLLLTTRAATRIDTDAGAAHQAIRQVWTFSALLLDAFAITGQSLVGYFVGAKLLRDARRVAGVVCMWSFAAGVLLCLLMLAGESLVAHALVPASAMGFYTVAWRISAVSQPLNALTFGTDGIHWGTGDFRYLRNAVVIATLSGALAIYLLDESAENAFALVWWITAGWITIRAVFGLARIWPGIGRAPLHHEPEAAA